MDALSDRVAIVTGGAQGIGRGIAAKLLRCGMTVVIGDRDESAAQRVAGRDGPTRPAARGDHRRCRRGPGPPPDRRGSPAGRAARRAREQRGHRHQQADRAAHARRMEPRAGDQPDVGVPDGQARGWAFAADARRDRQHLLDAGDSVGAQHGGLHRFEGRHRIADARPGGEPRTRGARQRDLSRLDRGGRLAEDGQPPMAGPQRGGPGPASGRAGSARPKTSRTWRRFCCRTRRGSSPARASRWTAG